MHAKHRLLHLIDAFSNLKTAGFLDELEKSQLLPYPEIRLRQWERLQELLNFAYRNCAFYRDRFNRHKLSFKDIKEPEDFQKLPPASKDDIREYLRLNPAGSKQFFIQTSGTTGASNKIFLDFETAGKKYALYLRHLLRIGWDFDTEIIYFLPSCYKKQIIDYRHGLLQCLATFVQNKISHTFFTNRRFVFYDDLSPEIDERQLKMYSERINTYKAKIIMARADFLSLLIYNLKRKGMRVARPKGIINIGTLFPSSLKDRCSSFFGCPVHDIYGSAELSYIAGSCREDNELHLNEETHYVECLQDAYLNNSDAPGSVVVTDLLNYTMPLIRYSIGDLGSIGNARCQYSGLRTLRIKGRKANCIDNNGEGLLMEEDICNAVFKDQNVLQFSLRFVKNGVSQIQVVRVDDGIADSSALQNLNDLGIKKINIKYVKNLSGNYADKLQYISIH